ncbi:MAG TPA: hypothetical protein VGH02_12380 [Rhizomicrobium sp.]|jgi:hypothetical protein
MLLSAFCLFTAAVLLGAVLSLSYFGLMRPRWWLGVIHGVIGSAGLIALFFSLGGPVRGVEYGVQSFGTIAAYLAMAGLLIGLGFATLRFFAKRRVTWLIGAHVTVAITAYFFLLAYVAF